MIGVGSWQCASLSFVQAAHLLDPPNAIAVGGGSIPHYKLDLNELSVNTVMTKLLVSKYMKTVKNCLVRERMIVFINHEIKWELFGCEFSYQLTKVAK